MSEDLPPRLPGAGRPVRLAVVPEGKLEMIVTYLEMRAPPAGAPVPHRAEQVALMRAERPTVSFYRYLYNTVGGPWLWYERRLLDDDALEAIVGDEHIEIVVLYARGVPAGFYEIDLRDPADVEIVYLGLVPDFIGHGLGEWLLDHAVRDAWSRHPERVRVHTCNLDHPRALAAYQRSGFRPYDQESTLIDDPRLPGSMPPGQEFA